MSGLPCSLIQVCNLAVDMSHFSNKANEIHLPFPSSTRPDTWGWPFSKGHVVHLTTSLIKKKTKGRKRLNDIHGLLVTPSAKGLDQERKWARISVCNGTGGCEMETRACALRTELKNWDQLPVNADYQKTETDLTKSLHPQADELTAWTLAGLITPRFHSLPITTACPTSSRDVHVARYSMHFQNCNCSAIPK